MIKGPSFSPEHFLVNLNSEEVKTLEKLLAGNLDSRIDELSLRFQRMESGIAVERRTEERRKSSGRRDLSSRKYRVDGGGMQEGRRASCERRKNDL